MDMNISPQDKWKILKKVLRERIYGNKDEELEKADKEELFYDNLQLKQEIADLKQRTADLKRIKFDIRNFILIFGEKGSINFSSTRYQLFLFAIICDIWENSSTKPVKIPKPELLQNVTKDLEETWDRDKLRSNLRHLNDKLKTNPKIAELIAFKI